MQELRHFSAKDLFCSRHAVKMGKGANPRDLSARNDSHALHHNALSHIALPEGIATLHPSAGGRGGPPPPPPAPRHFPSVPSSRPSEKGFLSIEPDALPGPDFDEPVQSGPIVRPIHPLTNCTWVKTERATTQQAPVHRRSVASRDIRAVPRRDGTTFVPVRGEVQFAASTLPRNRSVAALIRWLRIQAKI